MKTLLFFAILLVNSFSYSQTVTKKYIFKGLMTISEMESGRIWFGYQNPEYKYATDIVYFATTNKDSAIFVMDEALRILEMDKTDRDVDIEHKVDGVFMIRYGFAQKAIFLSNGKERGYRATKKQLTLYREKLMEYSYTEKVNQ